jgi:hypothetical protein
LSHTVKVNIIADQEVRFFGQYAINIHDIITISLNGVGGVVEVVTSKGIYTQYKMHPIPEGEINVQIP